MTDLEGLPASETIARGLSDLQEGALTVDALLVAVAARRLADLGLPMPPSADLPKDPELALYDLLCGQSDDPFFAYRARLDELDSFVSSLEARRASA